MWVSWGVIGLLIFETCSRDYRNDQALGKQANNQGETEHRSLLALLLCHSGVLVFKEEGGNEK